MKLKMNTLSDIFALIPTESEYLKRTYKDERINTTGCCQMLLKMGVSYMYFNIFLN